MTDTEPQPEPDPPPGEPEQTEPDAADTLEPEGVVGDLLEKDDAAG